MTDLRKAAEMALKWMEATHHTAMTTYSDEAYEEHCNVEKELRQALAQPEPVGFYVYKPVLPRGVTNINAENLPWVYDQAPSSGYMARMFVYAAPPKREQEPVCDKDPFYCWSIRCQVGKACKHAPSEQEPVAWMMPDYGDVLSASEADGTGIYNIPLYTAPPKREWVGLTDDEKNNCLVEADPCEALATPEAQELMREVEAKLKEKNDD